MGNGNGRWDIGVGNREDTVPCTYINDPRAGDGSEVKDDMTSMDEHHICAKSLPIPDDC